MKRIVQFQVYKGENAYVGEGIDLPIVTQGATLDEVVSNLKEAFALHLEGENPADFGFAPQPSALVNFELESDYAKA
ncbi:MAG: type II toxin-antitoxin system HicB family antitoxin [bacterium]|nr:type II toxin-antitoxin system HicB family antitoxin [bacterium]